MKEVPLPCVKRLQALVRGFLVRRRFQKVRCNFKEFALSLEDPSTVYFPSNHLCAPVFLPAGVPVPEPVVSQQTELASTASSNAPSSENLLSDCQSRGSETPDCIRLADEDPTDLPAHEIHVDAKVADTQCSEAPEPVPDVPASETSDAPVPQTSPEIPEDSVENPDARLDEVRRCLEKTPQEALLAERRELVEDVRCILEMMARRTDYLEQRAMRTAIS